jgi:hypothetical protein
MIFSTGFIPAATVLAAIAGVGVGALLILKGRSGLGLVAFVAYCAGLVALFLLDRSDMQSTPLLFALLLWIATSFGLTIRLPWAAAHRPVNQADPPAG